MDTTISAFVGIIIVALIMAIAIGALAALPVMWLWNWLCPLLFGLPTLTYLQAWGLFVLTHLLFGSSSISK